MMRFLTLAAATAAVALPAMPAAAQSTQYQASREYQRAVRDAKNDYYRDLRSAHTPQQRYRARQEYQAALRDARHDRRQDRQEIRDWHQYRNYDYNRLPTGQSTYYADQYYRDGRYYQPRRLTADDRVYVGRDNKYYCRRSDGTTGLIVGGIGGGVLGNVIAGGGSRTLGTLLGGAAGALLGRQIDRDQVTCR